MKVGDLVKDKTTHALQLGIIVDEVRFPHPHFMVVWSRRGEEWTHRNFLEVVSASR